VCVFLCACVYVFRILAYICDQIPHTGLICTSFFGAEIQGFIVCNTRRFVHTLAYNCEDVSHAGLICRIIRLFRRNKGLFLRIIQRTFLRVYTYFGRIYTNFWKVAQFLTVGEAMHRNSLRERMRERERERERE